ncbi:sensor histidine kinase [Acetobacter aceti]|uniref:histidine kinase n=1 Tax=Acetobacter aceti TaxID=435 RepID=A0A6S6PHX8_ACEAC|nr:sensor histidine kinase [Acetobacter aceti]BCI66305.1 histidine kinase [Acetobacter aceti]
MTGDGPQPGWRSYRFLVSFLIGIAGLFDSVRSRMVIVIMGSVLPVAALGSVVIWQDYIRLNEAGIQRGKLAFSELEKYLDGETFRTVAMLQQIGQAADDSSLRNLLLLAQAASKGRYCLLAVIDGKGGLQDVLTGSDSADGNCLDIARSMTPAKQSARLWVYGGHPYLKIVQELPAADSDDEKRFLVAIQPIGWEPGLSDEASSSHDGMEKASSKSLSAWFVMDDKSLVSVCPQCAWMAPVDMTVSQAAIEARHRAEQRRIVERRASRSYVYGPVGQADFALIEVRRLPEEKRALFLLFGWIAMVAVLLLTGLVGIMVAGQKLVIEPLNQLTRDVESWLKKGKFESVADSSCMPREFRKLSGAFGTATWRLAHREAELEAALEHQKRLVAEIHHRVKNNLQIVGSLLSLQANRVSDSDTRAALLVARNRVRILSMLQRHLYVGDELADLRMAEFLPILIQQIQQATPDDVRSRVTIEEEAGNVVLPPDLATPVVLIISEALQNALHYGFPTGRTGTVRVSLARKENILTLMVEDDSESTAALQAGLDEGGLGLQLVRGFARQIGGTLRIEEQDGLRVIVTCPVKQARREDGGKEPPIPGMRR